MPRHEPREAINITINETEDPRLAKSLTISEFITAFGKYKRKVCKKAPHRRIELDRYEANIVEISNVYGRKFYDYHCQFSARAAAALHDNIGKVDSWALKDNGLLAMIMDKESCSLSYVRIDDAIRKLQELGKGTTMCKTDISDAFKIIPVVPSQWHMFCVKWRDSYYYYNKLAFGCRPSPKIFDNLSQAVCWIAEHRYHIKHILHLLDDFITFEHPDNCEDRNMALLHLIFNLRLGIPMAKHKTCGPETVLEYLGIILDSEKMEARLSTDKLIRIIGSLKSFQQRQSCTKRKLLQLLGHLNFASRVVLQGRSFVSHLISLSTTVKALHHYVKLNNECREDIKLWIYFLSHWNGESVFYNNKVVTSDEMCLYTDASGTLGYGCYFQGLWFAEPTDLHNPYASSSDLSIAFKELYPIVVAAMIWGHMWVGQRIVFMCDNSATVAIIQKGRSKSPHIMPLVRSVTLCASISNFTVLSQHVPGRLNDIADSLSRLQINRFRQLAPQAAQFPCKVPPPTAVLWDSSQ
ncbi:uncharacterized protein LOC110456530 [Mizuhopecten yessoensis]|uniref:uncharacterized protein LOC110456530 n=1 Tax=Mizuhopecten yessoensis TaxID=6573 RepID=UPI000B45EFB1|nr:uncharacterized protein LOC110456530 [Mizuhopecten yessoensis]